MASSRPNAGQVRPRSSSSSSSNEDELVSSVGDGVLNGIGDAQNSMASPNHHQSIESNASSSPTSTRQPKRKVARRLPPELEYLDGPQIYACGQCRTHLTSHDDIISKCFHGRQGRAYLFDNCVNVVRHGEEDRILLTGRHRVCDISCIHCRTVIGWTYIKAYNRDQRYKEGKFIIEKINLFLEQEYDIQGPAMERSDRFRKRTMSWGTENSDDVIDEYTSNSKCARGSRTDNRR